MQRKNVNPLGHVMSFGLPAFVMLTLLLGGSRAIADEAISFEGKSITIIIGSETGGTTDASARLMGAFLSKYLAGKPNMVVQSRPGAHSLTAMNYFVQQVKPDGLTVAVGSGSQLDPINYRVPQSRYDPANFVMVGGVDLGGGIVILRKDAQARLTDKTAKPVVMGSPSGIPHSTMLPAAWGTEYLGWNVKWVGGYPSTTAAFVLALERGEIDMSAFSTSGLPGSLFDRSRYTILYQTGSNRCTGPSSLPVIAGVPLFAAAMEGKIADAAAKKAFDYWCNSSSIGTWMALPPGTPAAAVDAYRTAFGKLATDPAFLEQGRSLFQDFSWVSHESLTAAVRSNEQVSPEVIGIMPQMLRRQGLEVN